MNEKVAWNDSVFLMYPLPPQRLHVKPLPSLQDSSLKGYSEYKLITDLVYVIRVNPMPVMKFIVVGIQSEA